MWIRSRCAGRPIMKTAVLIGLLAGLLLTGSGTARGEASSAHGEIVLTVSLENSKGRVLCGLYERDGWLKRPLRGQTASIRGNVAACRFGSLKPGTYAAGAFQDANSNGKLDR